MKKWRFKMLDASMPAHVKRWHLLYSPQHVLGTHMTLKKHIIYEGTDFSNACDLVMYVLDQHSLYTGCFSILVTSYALNTYIFLRLQTMSNIIPNVCWFDYWLNELYTFWSCSFESCLVHNTYIVVMYLIDFTWWS